MHAVWVREWSLLFVGLSSSADVVLLTSDSAILEANEIESSWVACGPSVFERAVGLGLVATIFRDFGYLEEWRVCVWMRVLVGV